jgi:glycosyltransferase involved in cell wall biosynthesis
MLLNPYFFVNNSRAVNIFSYFAKCIKVDVVILMLGTSTNTKGGVATVVQSYVDSGFFDEQGVAYLATHADGSWLNKILVLSVSVFSFLKTAIFSTVEITHIHSASRASFYRKAIFIAMAKIFCIKVVFHLHGGEFRQFYEDESSRMQRQFIAGLLGRCDAIIVLSSQMKQWMAQLLPEDRIHVIHNTLPIKSDAAPRKLGVTPTILFLGRVGENKGVRDLLEAISFLKGKVPFEVTIAGDGEVEKYRRMADSMGLSDQVKFPGWIGLEQKELLLNKASVLVLPSYNEGMPMSVVEALVNGIPVVTSNVGGIPDVVQHGLNGYLMEPGDVKSLAGGLLQVLTDKEAYEKMSAHALNNMRSNFSMETTKLHLAEVYDSLDPERVRSN